MIAVSWIKINILLSKGYLLLFCSYSCFVYVLFRKGAVVFLSRIGTFNASTRTETIVLIKVPRYFYLIPCHTSLLQFPLNIRTLKIIFSLLIFSSFFLLSLIRKFLNSAQFFNDCTMTPWYDAMTSLAASPSRLSE